MSGLQGRMLSDLHQIGLEANGGHNLGPKACRQSLLLSTACILPARFLLSMLNYPGLLIKHPKKHKECPLREASLSSQ